MEKQLLRSLVLEVLAKEPKTQVVSLTNGVERLAAENGLFPSADDCQRFGLDYKYYQAGSLNPVDKLIITEIIWDLIIENIVRPGFDASNLNLPFIRLTEFGKEYIAQSAPHYYDPQGYMERLKDIVTNLDPVIEQYIFESLNCFRRQLHFAAAVMLGAAAEKTILLLLQSIANSIEDVKKKKEAEQLLERHSLPKIFNMISKTINALIESKTIPYSVHEGCVEHLVSVFEMFRVQRNDAIHPICGQVDRSKVFLSLQTMPIALESVYKLIGWFEDNSI